MIIILIQHGAKTSSSRLQMGGSRKSCSCLPCSLITHKKKFAQTCLHTHRILAQTPFRGKNQTKHEKYLNLSQFSSWHCILNKILKFKTSQKGEGVSLIWCKLLSLAELQCNREAMAYSPRRLIVSSPPLHAVGATANRYCSRIFPSIIIRSKIPIDP